MLVAVLAGPASPAHATTSTVTGDIGSWIDFGHHCLSDGNDGSYEAVTCSDIELFLSGVVGTATYYPEVLATSQTLCRYYGSTTTLSCNGIEQTAGSYATGATLSTRQIKCGGVFSASACPAGRFQGEPNAWSPSWTVSQGFCYGVNFWGLTTSIAIFLPDNSLLKPASVASLHALSICVNNNGTWTVHN